MRCLFLQANPNELTNGVINSAFMLLFKDSIRLFAAYNEGVINLLGNAPGVPSGLPSLFLSSVLSGFLWSVPVEKYFDMKKNQCKDALDIYKKFLYRMTKLSEFLKVAEVKSERFRVCFASDAQEVRVPEGYRHSPRMEGVVRCSVSRLFPLLHPNPLRTRSPPDRDRSSSGSPFPSLYGSKLNPQQMKNYTSIVDLKKKEISPVYH